MKLDYFGKVFRSQDGAIFDGLLFRFDSRGNCRVYDMRGEKTGDEKMLTEVAAFTLDKADIIAPHSNAVVFGTEYLYADDEFPLMYSNIYNNYSSAADPLRGVCCVYRIARDGEGFTSSLVQIIEIGFTDDPELWISSAENGDYRPYGNFVVDTEKNLLYAFTMRDACQSTRYFAFDLPKAADGEIDPRFGVKRVVLCKEQIKSKFDCPYHLFLQGATLYNGKIYSVEGFTNDKKHPPAMRVINTETQKQELYFPFGEAGLTVEPEMVSFMDGKCYYGDNHGNIYMLDF